MRLARDQILYHTALDSSYVPRKIRHTVLTRDGYKCRFCLKPTKYVCHDLPKCRGGKTTIDNLLTCCRACSRKKGEGTAQEFEEELAGGALLSVEDVFKDMYMTIELHLSSGEVLTDEVRQVPHFI